MARSYIALGANLAGPHGPPRDTILAAMDALDRDGAAVTARSRLYGSAAWPDPGDPEFVNAVVRIETPLSSAALLARLHAIEADFGRVRGPRNSPRTLDLDIVDYDGRSSAPGDIPVLPHPRLAHRAFVLLPLADVAPDWRHPVTGRTVAALIASLPDAAAAWPIVP